MAAKKRNKSTLTGVEPSDFTITLPDGQPFAMSIKAGKDYLAISIRYGHGSDKMPAFGAYPKNPPNQVGVMGGGDGDAPCQP